MITWTLRPTKTGRPQFEVVCHSCHAVRKLPLSTLVINWLDPFARQASAFRPGKESAKPVRASLGSTDQSAAVAQEHQPCELFPIARA